MDKIYRHQVLFGMLFGELSSGMRIRIRWFMALRIHFFFLLDPYPNPTCNNGFIESCSSWTKYKSESTILSLKRWLIRSNFLPTYLPTIYFFSSFRIKVGAGAGSGFFSAEPDPDPRKKVLDPHPWFFYWFFIEFLPSVGTDKNFWANAKNWFNEGKGCPKTLTERTNKVSGFVWF